VASGSASRQSATALHHRCKASRRRVRIHARCGECLREGFGPSRLTVTDKGEALLDARGTDYLPRDHLEMTLLLAMAAAHIAAQPRRDLLVAARPASPGLDGVLATGRVLCRACASSSMNAAAAC
jgi:hypothetical protein